MLHREIITYEIHTNTLFGQNVELLNVKLGGTLGFGFIYIEV
jgi:hypothetical protein